MLHLVIGKLLKKPSAKPSCHTKKNILQQCCVQSCIWQSKQLWQHNTSEQSCLRSRVNGPPLMCLTGHFVSTRLTTHDTSTHTCKLSHNHTLPPFPIGFVCSFLLSQTNKHWSFLCFLSDTVSALFPLICSSFTLKTIQWIKCKARVAGGALSSFSKTIK